MFWQEYLWSQNIESELFYSGKIQSRNVGKIKEVKKDALEYKNYFFLLNKNEVLIEASKKSRKASKKIQTRSSGTSRGSSSIY